MKVELKRVNKAFHYEAFNENKIKVDIDANPAIGGEEKGARPMELVLMALASCASIDLGLILKKQKQELVDYKVEVAAERVEGVVPGRFKSINLHFKLYGKIDDQKANRAIDLAVNKYCSVGNSLRDDIKITTSYEIK